MVIFFFLLGGSAIPHTPIPYAIVHILIIAITSGVIFSEGIVSFRLLRKGFNSQQFFLIIIIYMLSFLPNFLFFFRRFQANMPDTMLSTLAKAFNFFYIETIFLVILSILTINIKYKKDVLLFFFSVFMSALLATNAPITVSNTANISSIFMGGKILLLSMGFSLCILALGLYVLNLLKINLKFFAIIEQIIFFLGFLLSFHALLLFSSLILILIFSILIIVCTFGYLRGIFVHTL